MPPPLRSFGGGPNNMAHYQQYPQHSQGHAAGLQPPSLTGMSNSFMNPNSNINPFAVNGNTMGLAQGFGASGGLGVGGGTGLASHAAQIGFAHAGNIHQPHGRGEQGPRGMANKGRIRDVYKSNLAEEMDTLRRLVDKYPYISMDIEFPGLVARPMGAFRGKSDYHYQTLRSNVDLLHLIQLGITLFSEDGELVPAQTQSDSGLDMNTPGSRKYGNTTSILPCTWQFNFKFSLKEDMYAQMSIDLLQQAGVDFQLLEKDGIEPFEFGANLISSGLVCDEDVRWISFHGGYDFGYLTKLMICKPLPDDEVEYDMLVRKFFPSIFEVKYLMKFANKQHSMGQGTPLDQSTIELLQKFETKPTLDHTIEVFQIKRIGQNHQAGTDAFLTGKVFFKMREMIYSGEISPELLGKVWGLGSEHGGGFLHSTPQHYHPSLPESSTPGPNGSSYGNGAPSTPNIGHVGLDNTSAGMSSGGIGALTPGGGGGVFGAFQFAKQ